MQAHFTDEDVLRIQTKQSNLVIKKIEIQNKDLHWTKIITDIQKYAKSCTKRCPYKATKIITFHQFLIPIKWVNVYKTDLYK